MSGIDTLVVIGLNAINLGTIHEADGVVEQQFSLRNEHATEITLIQGYTSCGCTSIEFPKDKPVSSGDTTHVTVRFNPRGKAGEFYEVSTIVYEASGHRNTIQMSLQGICESSEETLMRQYPIRVSDHLRQSTDQYDLGNVHIGQTIKRHLSLLWTDSIPTRQLLPLTYSPPADIPPGIHHITQSIPIIHDKKSHTIHITYHINIINPKKQTK